MSEKNNSNSHRRGGGPKAAAKPSRSARGKRFGASAAGSAPSGLAARELSVDLIAAVLHEQRAFDETWTKAISLPAYQELAARDLGMARTTAANALRYALPLNAVLAEFIEKPLPARQSRVAAILLSATAQLLLLRTPAHAAISLAVEQTARSRSATHLKKFVNAVLRKVAEQGPKAFSEIDTAVAAIPEWLWRRWTSAYGTEMAHAIAEASLREAPLDLSLKSSIEASNWADRLGAKQLATGTLRLQQSGRVDELPGFSEGAWWVQDAASALPARLFTKVAGAQVADLCAAPGGKTAQLAALGAHVCSVDSSPARLDRARENLERLSLDAEFVVADAATWRPDQTFDAVLLDAPCTATGTIRRHPDILHLKRDKDIAALADLQQRILDNAACLVRLGGELVYATCSLQPEEGEEQISRFLAQHKDFEVSPISEADHGVEARWLTNEGYLRTLPCWTPRALHGEELSAVEGVEKTGMDGFFAARLRRRESGG